MIQNIRITLAILICLLQIMSVKLANQSIELSQTETASLFQRMDKRIRCAQTIPYKKSCQIIFKENNNISKQAAL